MASSCHWQRVFCLLLVLASKFNDSVTVVLAVVAASRSFDFVVCHLAQSSADISEVQAASSLLACTMLCARHPTCRSATFCQQKLTQECSLSASPPSCQSLTSSQGCSFLYMNNLCHNGGVLNKASITCECPPGWQGTLCQTPTATSGTAVSTTTVMSTTASKPLTTTPFGCLSDYSTCATALLKTTLNQVIYCCPSSYHRISGTSSNSVITCTCS